MKLKLLAGLIGSALPLMSASAQEKTAIPPGTPVTITVTQAAPAAPDVSISLLKRTGKVTPCNSKCVHTGGGNIDVQQPSPDTLVITMTGVAVAYGSPFGAGEAGLNFDLAQVFEVSYDKPTVKAAKLSIEGRVIGLLRSSCKGGSAEENGCANINANGTPVVALVMPGHAVSGGENLSVNDHEGPITGPAPAGQYTLTQTFSVHATMPRGGMAKAPSVEFAPDPALDPLWISSKEPFHGAAKKDFGYQVTIKVSPEELKEEPLKKGPEKVVPPMKLSQINDLKPFAVIPSQPLVLPAANAPRR